jgi:hypothetical protein
MKRGMGEKKKGMKQGYFGHYIKIMTVKKSDRDKQFCDSKQETQRNCNDFEEIS